MWAIMRSRARSSGNSPKAAPILSTMWRARPVAGVATVTTGWEITNLRKNCAQEWMPSSAAHAGSS